MAVIADLGQNATRAKLLRGTARVVARKGVDAATVADILQAAGFSRRTFYQSFANKDEALYALFEVVTDTLMRTVRDAAVSAEPEEHLLQGARAYLALWQSNARLSRVLQTEAMRAGSPLAPLRKRVLDTLSEDCARVYAEATGDAVDPLVFRTTFLALEGLLSHAVEAADVDDARVLRVVEALARRTLGPGEVPLPAPAARRKVRRRGRA